MYVLSQNRRMLFLARALGFDYKKAADGFMTRELGKSLDDNAATQTNHAVKP
jgi:hypothetical protein